MSSQPIQTLQLGGATIPGIRPVFYLVGTVLLATAIMMVPPLLVDLYVGNGDWRSFGLAAAISAIIGGGLMASCRGALKGGLTLRQAFLLTPTSWFSVAVVSALPFYFSDYGIVSGSLADAVFEAVSGITTTGATVISGLGEAPPGMLLWRGLLQWMGGIGIIASAIAILPALGIGGMQLFRTESSDRSEKALPQIRQIATAIGGIYLGLTVLAVGVYWLAGMAPFDAVVHGLTSIATGGYSTSDASFGAWEDNGIQWFATAFMLSGAIPFVLYVRLVAGEGRALWDRQVMTLLAFVVIVAFVLGLWLAISGQYALEPAFRHAAFNVVSVVTTTGYATTDYQSWSNAAIGIFFALTFIGGCTGSTSGGIKIFRFEVMGVMLRAHFMRLIYPRGMFPRTYANRTLDDEVIGSVVAFFAVYFCCYAVLTIALMALGLDFLTSSSGATTALSNVGPGLGEIIGPAGNFGPLPDGAKWLLSFGMMLGRLELFTVLVLFLPRFWRG
ncbi:TrkH family potassium uptake protein [Arsenicitalea aurantiaca]|uniref:Trk system potassium uptake protein n=1 Tax=Arsenicitalea aurantiaca TaxID=1783274 RepID=A0A433XAJ4_9HYPH|nr:TrkH family potassium uptake protein [Arsenicitalea aurantiaca]RUT31082.1 TrkH family potassium uptake protein [Arsenicitalea aurantiaca]